jgi:hypothetical protein
MRDDATATPWRMYAPALALFASAGLSAVFAFLPLLSRGVSGPRGLVRLAVASSLVLVLLALAIGALVRASKTDTAPASLVYVHRDLRIASLFITPILVTFGVVALISAIEPAMHGAWSRALPAALIGAAFAAGGLAAAFARRTVRFDAGARTVQISGFGAGGLLRRTYRFDAFDALLVLDVAARRRGRIFRLVAVSTGAAQRPRVLLVESRSPRFIEAEKQRIAQLTGWAAA